MINVMLVDDQNLVRKGVRSLLELSEEIEVIAEAADGAEAIRMIPEVKPDVVLLDMRMPGLSGLDVLRELSRAGTLPATIILTTFDDDELVLAGIKSGARGYLLKDVAFEELVNAIRTVMDNRNYLCPKIAKTVLEDYKEHLFATDLSASVVLTTREREVLQLVAEGRTTKQIGERLNVSIKTVETHRRNIMEKLDVYSIAELTKFAIRQGLTSVDT